MTYKPTFNSSVLSERDEQKVNFSNKIFNNTALKVGIVLEIIEEDDEKNQSKLGPEYHVMTIEQEGQRGSNSSIYKNCINIDAFGGAADYFQFRHRAVKDINKTKENLTFKNQTGSIVLLLCLDGNSEKAVIIKSIHNPKKNKVLTKDKGHHLEGEFNGVNWQVDKDGALKITFKSATEDDGTPKNKEAGGTFLEIDKEGSFKIDDGKEENIIGFNKTNGNMTLKANKNISTTAKEEIFVTSGKSTIITSKKDIIAAAEGKVTHTAKQSYDIKADGKFSVVSSNVNIRSDGAATLEAGGNITLKGTKILIGNSPTPALVMGTKFMGTGNLGGPVICSPIGPFSSSVLISS